MSRAQQTSTVEQNTGGAVAPFLAGKNKIINGDFGIWQRGTSFSNPNGVYVADRFNVGAATAVPSWTISQQAFTAGNAITGYESAYFMRAALTAQNGSTSQYIRQYVEDVRTFAGQTITFSFWLKADAAYNLGNVVLGQNFGSGGSGAVETTILTTPTTTTGWTRYSGTISVPSISGKTIGTGSYVYIYITYPAARSTYTIDTWGWQLEAGSVATPFTTASGTLQGELALCQRYFQVVNANALFNARSGSTTLTDGVTYLPVTMRTSPALAATAPLKIDQAGVANFTQSSASVSISGFADAQNVGMTAGNFTGLPSANVWLFLRTDGGKIWMSAEL